MQFYYNRNAKLVSVYEDYFALLHLVITCIGPQAQQCTGRSREAC